MTVLLSILISLSMAQDIRLRLLSSQKHIPIIAEKIHWSEGESQALSITYDSNKGYWLIQNNRTGKTTKSEEQQLHIEAVDAIIHGRKLSGKFTLVWNDRRKGIDVIYPVDLEKYLLGVIPAEMPPSWPLEALKAQVVASRSYVLVQMQNQVDQHFDVDSSVMDQVFNKKKFEALSEALQNKIRFAIDSTKHEVLFSDKKIFKTYFHSRCGGHTENPRTVWNDSWKWEGKKDPYCSLDQGQNWSYSVSLQTVAKGYSANTGEDAKDLVRLISGKRTLSGRADHVFLFFKDGRIRRWSTQELRKEVGFSNVKSTLFDLETDGQKLTFRGKGFGHGVGLCQFGARQMAKIGKKHHEILQFYYPSAELRAVKHWPTFLARLHGTP